MYVCLIEVLGEFNSLLWRWTIPFLFAQTNPRVLVAIWRCLGEGRGQWSSKATPLTPEKYTRDGGWLTDWNSSFCSHVSRKGNVVPERKEKQPYKTVSAFPQETHREMQRPPGSGSVQMYCPRRKLGGRGGGNYPAWQRKIWSVSLYISVTQQ